MENGILLDLTDQIAKSEVIELENYYADIVNLYSYDGKHYAIPKDIDTIGLWYNKTYLTAKALPPLYWLLSYKLPVCG